jgi:hypothetical protein
MSRARDAAAGDPDKSQISGRDARIMTATCRSLIVGYDRFEQRHRECG